MKMTSLKKEQLQIIRANWEAILPNANLAARLFYTRLFLIEPSLSIHFRRNAEEEAQRLMRALGIAVHGLGQPRILQPLLHRLGSLQAARGVKSNHYDAAGEALLWTLEITLAGAFTEEARRAWEALCGAIGEALNQAALQGPCDCAGDLRKAA